MNAIKFDIIEVMLKIQLKIPLTEEEEKWINNIDNDIKEATLIVLDDDSYADELLRSIHNILISIGSLSLEEQQYVKARCEEKIAKIYRSINNSKVLLYK